MLQKGSHDWKAAGGSFPLKLKEDLAKAKEIKGEGRGESAGIRWRTKYYP